MNLSDRMKQWCDADYCTCANTVQGWAQQVGELEAELALHKEALKLACESVQEWGNYAGEYFQDKWNLEADCKPETHLRAARKRL